MSQSANQSKMISPPLRFWVRRPPDAHPGRRQFLPGIDRIEDRTLLSTVTVMNNHHSGPGHLAEITPPPVARRFFSRKRIRDKSWRGGNRGWCNGTPAGTSSGGAERTTDGRKRNDPPRMRRKFFSTIDSSHIYMISHRSVLSRLVAAVRDLDTIHTRSPACRTAPGRWAAGSRAARRGHGCWPDTRHTSRAGRSRDHNTGRSSHPPGRRIPIPPRWAGDSRCAPARRPGSSSPRRKPRPCCGGSTTGPWASPPARSASCSRRRLRTSRGDHRPVRIGAVLVHLAPAEDRIAGSPCANR